MRIPKGKSQGYKLAVEGGPWDKKVVFIPHSGTMVFRIGPYHGLYTHLGVWVELDGKP